MDIFRDTVHVSCASSQSYARKTAIHRQTLLLYRNSMATNVVRHACVEDNGKHRMRERINLKSNRIVNR